MTKLEFIEDIIRNDGVCPHRGCEVIDLVEGWCPDCDSDVNFHIGEDYFEMSHCSYYGKCHSGAGICSLDWCPMLREVRGSNDNSRD